MGIKGPEHQDNKYEDTERNNDTRKPNADDQVEDNNNEISSIMDKQYGMRKRVNMQARRQKCDLPPKMHIHPTINNEVKRSKIQHSNNIV